MKKIYITLSLAVVLTGCYSFNRITIPPNGTAISPLGQEIARHIVGLKKTDEKENTCPPFVLPALPKTPELPYDELLQINPNDSEAIDAIQRNHIKELRDHIVKYKLSVKKAYDDYLLICKDYNEKSTQLSAVEQ